MASSEVVETKAVLRDAEIVGSIRLLTVKIPEDKKPGDVFIYKDEADGEEMQIVVPDEYKPGDTMEILIDDDDDDEIDSVSVFLGPHLDVTLNMVTFIDEPGETAEILDTINETLDENPKKSSEEGIIADQEDEDADGTNFMVWPSGVELAQLIASPSAKLLLDGKKRALELGSGCGVAGMALVAALARRGGCDIGGEANTEITVTDLPVAMPLLKANFQENESILVAETGLQTRVEELSWGDDGNMKNILGEKSKFDLIIGADLLYDPTKEKIAALTDTMDNLLDPSTGLILLATRWRKNDEERGFFQKMDDLGYEFILAKSYIKELGGDDASAQDSVEDKNLEECPLSWRDFGNEESEESKKYFSETMFTIKGVEKSLSQIEEEEMAEMEADVFDDYELTFIQIYAGYKKK